MSYTENDEYIVAVVISSYETSVEEAAKEHNCDPQTVRKYRRWVKERPVLRERFQMAWNVQRVQWASKLGTTREKLLAQVAEMAARPDANLKDVTAAFKAISESFVADAIMLEGSQMPQETIRGSANQSAKAPRPAKQVQVLVAGEISGPSRGDGTH